MNELSQPSPLFGISPFVAAVANHHSQYMYLAVFYALVPSCFYALSVVIYIGGAFNNA